MRNIKLPTLQVRHMDRYTKRSHKGQPAQEPALLYAQTTPYGATQTHIIDDREDRVCVQQAVWQYGGWTLLASSFYRYQQQFRRT
jgi:hypothetical protein